MAGTAKRQPNKRTNPRTNKRKRPTPAQPKPPRRLSKAKLTALLDLLDQTWPDAVVELDHDSAYQLLVATILAAQSTDKMINKVTPALFERYPHARALAGADPEELQELIHRTGFFRMKAKHLLGMARDVVAHHDGQIPRTMEALVALPGVARKTANVVLGSFFGIASGIVVDTHMQRLAFRLGLSRETNPVKIERELTERIPRERWIAFSQQIIWHGRRVCHARKPACEECALAPLCPSASLGA